jgi:signal transduction histidine kinase
MKPLHVIRVVVVCISIVLLTFLFFRSQVANSEIHISLEQTLTKFREQDARLKQAALKVRYGILRHYDVLTDANRKIGTLLNDLQSDLAGLGATEELDELVVNYRTLHVERQRDIDEFKRQTALLNNSLDHFPVSARTYLESNRNSNDLSAEGRERLSSLINLTFVNTTKGNSSHIKQANSEIQILRKIITGDKKEFLRLLRHAEIINNEIMVVDEITTRLSSDKGTVLDRQIQNAHQRFYQQQDWIAQRYRSALFVFSIFLILVVVYFLTRLTLARNNLGTINEKLAHSAKELKEALGKEQELNKLQRQFVSMASHEFRTPLTIIDMAAQRLKRQAEENQLTTEEAAQRVEKIRAAVQRMTRLMESTLDAARMDEGKIKVEIGECDLRYVVLEVLTNQIELSPGHNITCEFLELPDGIQGDSKALNRVFTNLLSNAVKYAPDAPDIEVKAHTEGDQVVISVCDHGIGIDEDELDRIGDRFFRAKTSTGTAGTGIGLNLAKTLVEMHGGSFNIESVKGEGSTFTVYLPIAGPDQSEQVDIKAA